MAQRGTRKPQAKDMPHSDGGDRDREGGGQDPRGELRGAQALYCAGVLY